MIGPGGLDFSSTVAKYGNLVSPSGATGHFGLFNPTEQVVQLLIQGDKYRKPLFSTEYQDSGASYGDHTTYGKMICIGLALGTYPLSYPDFKTLQNNFLNEKITFTEADGVPKAGTWSSYKDTLNIELIDWTMIKTATRTYRLRVGATKILTKQVRRDLPAKST